MRFYPPRDPLRVTVTLSQEEAEWIFDWFLPADEVSLVNIRKEFARQIDGSRARFGQPPHRGGDLIAVYGEPTNPKTAASSVEIPNPGNEER